MASTPHSRLGVELDTPAGMGPYRRLLVVPELTRSTVAKAADERPDDGGSAEAARSPLPSGDSSTRSRTYAQENVTPHSRPLPTAHTAEQSSAASNAQDEASKDAKRPTRALERLSALRLGPWNRMSRGRLHTASVLVSQHYGKLLVGLAGLLVATLTLGLGERDDGPGDAGETGSIVDVPRKIDRMTRQPLRAAAESNAVAATSNQGMQSPVEEAPTTPEEDEDIFRVSSVRPSPLMGRRAPTRPPAPPRIARSQAPSRRTTPLPDPTSIAPALTSLESHHSPRSGNAWRRQSLRTAADAETIFDQEFSSPREISSVAGRATDQSANGQNYEVTSPERYRDPPYEIPWMTRRRANRSR